MNTSIDRLIQETVFSNDTAIQNQAIRSIHLSAEEHGISPSSLFPLYQAIGQGQISKQFTVPAINIRTLTFDTAAVIFRLMKKRAIGPVIFEIARSEMGYTEQKPKEYSSAILAAALSAEYHGPVFIQGDHFQIHKDRFESSQDDEINALETLIQDSITAKFFNIDIDASTIVDMTQDDLHEQQKRNAEITAHFTSFIRNHQPDHVTLAIGGEIGHIGGVNSTVKDFRAFMDQYKKLTDVPGISKVSVQTGSSHGGTPMPDGTVKKISIDFSVLNSIGDIAKNTYLLAGAVQHGASTLPLSLFDQFPQNNTCEVHLATGFQNIVFDTMPQALKEDMYDYIQTHFLNERKPGQTDTQFTYTLRKKTLGPFKKQLWGLKKEEKEPILLALEHQFEAIFEKLGIFDTREILERYYSL